MYKASEVKRGKQEKMKERKNQMRIIGSIKPIKLSSSDFDNEKYRGLQVATHSTYGNIALLESKSSDPKRYAITFQGRVPVFLSHQKALEHFRKLSS